MIRANRVVFLQEKILNKKHAQKETRKSRIEQFARNNGE